MNRAALIECADTALVFGLLKNPNRLRILTVLFEEEMCVTRLVAETSLKQSALSHHLRHLREAGLVQMRKDGSFHLFSVDKARAAPYLYPVEAAAGTGPSELVYVWDIATGEQKWFGDVDAALGFKPGEFPRTSDAWESRVHPKDYPRILEAAEKHLLSGEPFLEKYRMKKADGTYATWLDCGTVMRDATKRPYKWVGMTREIA